MWLYNTNYQMPIGMCGSETRDVFMFAGMVGQSHCLTFCCKVKNPNEHDEETNGKLTEVNGEFFHSIFCLGTLTPDGFTPVINNLQKLKDKIERELPIKKEKLMEKEYKTKAWES